MQNSSQQSRHNKQRSVVHQGVIPTTALLELRQASDWFSLGLYSFALTACARPFGIVYAYNSECRVRAHHVRHVLSQQRWI